MLVKKVETSSREGGVLSDDEVPEVVDEAPSGNLTLVLSEDDAGGDAGGGDHSVGGEENDVTLGEETDGSDPTSEDVIMTEMVASTPMVTVKKETVAEVTSLVDKFLCEVTAPEKEGHNVTRIVDVVEGGQTEDGEIGLGEEAGLELSRLSGTRIEELGDASDECWLLDTGEFNLFKGIWVDESTLDTGEVSSEESGASVESVAGATLARRLRMRSVNKYNTWLTRLDRESAGEVPPELVGPKRSRRTRSVSTGAEQESASFLAEGVTFDRGLRVQSVDLDNSWEVVELGATTRFTPD